MWHPMTESVAIDFARILPASCVWVEESGLASSMHSQVCHEIQLPLLLFLVRDDAALLPPSQDSPV